MAKKKVTKRKVTKSKYRELTFEEKEQIWGDAENQGLGYGVQEGYFKEYKGTRFGELAAQVQPLLQEMDEIVHACETALIVAEEKAEEEARFNDSDAPMDEGLDVPYED